VMHDSEHYGYFEAGGKPIPDEMGARLCGCTLKAFTGALQELMAVGVPSKDDKGVIYSRRMVRDESERLKETLRKRRQRGLSDFCPENVPPLSGKCPAVVPPMSQRSSSSSSSSSSEMSTSLPPKSPKGDIGEDQHRIDSGTIDAIYQQYPRHVGKAAALKAIRVALRGIASRLGAPSDPAAWLTERVKRYADARAGQDPQFTPHPATWFNQGRFDDDPAEWVRRGCEANGGQRQVPPGSGSVAQPSGNPGSYPSPRHRDEKSRREYPEPTRVIPTFG
jgi:hypothetical protein